MRAQGGGGLALGVDVGSTTAKVVVAGAAGEVLWARVARHRGRAREVALGLVASVPAGLAIGRRGVTGSLGVPLAAELDATAVHEVQAVIAAVRRRAPSTRTIVELGGQDAKMAFLGPAGACDTEMNDRCAAGTGATIDRIAHRLGLDEAALAALRFADLQDGLHVAAKCGVFAENDVVNLVKRGVPAGAALGALAAAIVVQNLAVLARGRTALPDVLLLGGPHAHLPILREAWTRAFEELWRERGVAPGAVSVPEHAALFAAIGAAIHVAEGGRPLAVVRGVCAGARELGPLVEPGEDARLLDALRPVRSPEPPRGPIEVHLGVDAGSTTSKAVLLDGHGQPVFASYAPSTRNPIDDARDRIDELFARAASAGAEVVVRSAGVTGYGAELVGEAFGADALVVETIAHVTSAIAAAPEIDALVDVGGSDVKVVRLEDGRIADFFLSNQCAAGLGAFLAAAASDLGVPLEGFAGRALSAQRTPRFTVGCAVFMDTDRVTFQREGYTTDELLAGLAWSLPRNVWELVVPMRPERLGRRFLLSGGAHRNLAVAWAQARYLRERVPGARVRLHPQPELAGAIGAALVGRRAVGTATRFAAVAARPVRVVLEAGPSARCTRCNLACARTIVSIGERRAVTGNACERGLEEIGRGNGARSHAPDLLAEEARRLFRPLLPPADRRVRRSAPVFGIPRVMGLYRAAPLLLHYLRAAGVPPDHLVLSPPTSPALFQEGARWGVNDPCFPAKLVLSHVDWLLRRHRERALDFLLMPAVTHAAVAVRGTADTASCPIVAACGHTTLAALRRDGDALARLGIEPLVPELCLSSRSRLDAQLRGAFGPVLGLDEAAHRAAFEQATRAQAVFLDRSRRRGAHLLARARAQGRAAALVLARPYHGDPGVQHGLSTELAARGIPVLGLCSLPLDPEQLDLSGVLPLATNSGSAEKVWGARAIAASPNLVGVELSSFRCGQDASAWGTLEDILPRGRPFLRLHDLDEDRPAASLRVRIETFVETVRRYEAGALRAGGDAA